jgi:phosphopantothenoylcysteine synthetase/decarboxylase
MPSFGSATGNVLYLIASAAPPASHLPPLITAAQDAGWDVCLIATPSALPWLNPDELAELTGHPVRSDFRHPTEAEIIPLGDAVLLFPATFNTLNKWAAGINDTLALGLLNEALGRDVPVVVLPWVNDALAAHPVYKRTLSTLQLPRVTFVTAPSSDARSAAREIARFLPYPDRNVSEHGRS